MSRLSRTFLLPLSLSVAALAPVHAAELTLELQGIRTPVGHLQVALVDSDEAWNNRAPPLQAQRIAAGADELRIVFQDVAPGRYAVMVMHDENDNGKLDTNLVGMPIEGYGFSNNPRVMRKPTWEESGFEVGADDLAITVQLR